MSDAGAWIRPMRAADVAAAERLTATAYAGADRVLGPPGARADDGDPGRPAAPVAHPGRRDPVRAEQWRRRTAHLLATDPGGCWVAEDDGDLRGVAVSFTRELMWVLASYAVAPGAQGRGLGRVLLEAALGHGRGCLRGMLCSSPDPAAVRRYRLAGFALHPHMLLTGAVDRTALPVLGRLRDGGAADRDLLDSVDRRARGAAHGPDHEVLRATTARLVVADRPTGQGYAYLGTEGSPVLLAATTRRVAEDLAWEALASAPVGAEVRLERVSAANQWALDVGLTAGLAVHQRGYLALRHCRPPTTYLPHASLL